MLRKCDMCGKVYNARNLKQRYCSRQCAGRAHSDQQCERTVAEIESEANAELEQFNRIADKALKETRPPVYKTRKQQRFDEVIKQAAECGMSYGKYRAARDQLGKTFDELRAEYLKWKVYFNAEATIQE